MTRRFKYKKVGDDFTLDECNALVYLLSKNSSSRTVFELDGETSGSVDDLELKITSDNIIFTNGHFLYDSKMGGDITFEISSDWDTEYRVVLFYSKTTAFTSEGIWNDETIPVTVYINPSEEFSDYHSAIRDKNARCSVEATSIYTWTEEKDYNKRKCKWTPPINSTDDDVILFDYMIVYRDFTSPMINAEDGYANQPDEFLCSNFGEIRDVINLSPPGSNIKIRLKGRSVVRWDEEIRISDEKTVTIIGGNEYTYGYTYFHGHNKTRFFYVEPDATLNLKMISFSKGNAYGGSDSFHNGGAIYVTSEYLNNAGQIDVHVGRVNLYMCFFYKCVANRGGGIYNNGGLVDMEKCVFHDCLAVSEETASLTSHKERLASIDYNGTTHVGGAIFNSKLPDIYDINYNELIIDTLTLNKTEKGLTFDLMFNVKQNEACLDILNNTTFTTKNFILQNWDTDTQIKINNITKINHYNYKITIAGLSEKEVGTYYFIYKGTTTKTGLTERTITQTFMITPKTIKTDTTSEVEYDITIPTLQVE